MRHVCTFLLCFVVSGFAFGQDSKADLFGGYSYLNIDTNALTSRQNANGWETSLSGNFNKWFAVEGAVSGYYKSYDILGINVSVQDYSYVAGPRLNFKPLFIHALLGGDHLSAGALGASVSQDGLAGAFGGGVQYRASGPWSFRASADYALSRHNVLGGSSVTQNNFRVSAGIVYSFRGTRVEPHQATLQHATGGMQIPVFGAMVRPGNTPGAEIVDEAPNGVAALAGLHPGDVINAVDGKPVSTPMELAAALSRLVPGAQVRIGYLLRGQWESQTMVLLPNR
jgi:hypothetical protein